MKDNKQFIWNKEHQYSETKRKSQKFGFQEHKREGFELKSKNYRIANIWNDIPETTWNWKSISKKHFTPKPEGAIERIIQLHTKEEDVILDCFAGSGTTGVVAKRMNREYILIEKEPEYISLIAERLANV